MFYDYFKRATGLAPYPYQSAFAESRELPRLLNIPTGVGKTATAVLGWLYRSREADVAIGQSTPRRLVYCLPMRTLVEQTERATLGWLERLEIEDIGVHLLMGGADARDWDEHPEVNAILIGTQDMLLSRALNRGFGSSRYRWPMHYGMLNNDCLWVFDETQLMGVGLTTSAQLQGLREKLKTYGITHSLWMSATLDASPINTVDHAEPPTGFSRQTLSEQDRNHELVQRRLTAKKALAQAEVVLTPVSDKKGYAKDLAAAVFAAHREKTLTLVVLNRVSRSQEVFEEVRKLLAKRTDATRPEAVLIHARFRPHDRLRYENLLFSTTMLAMGRIVIATQAIEAGVDVSAATMFTELAPWSSLVQRFGRCNRGGEFTDAHVFWIDLQPKDAKDKLILPYELDDLEASRRLLMDLDDVGPASLANVSVEPKRQIVHTLRRKDLLELWDTTPDLAGNDLDVSRFIRDANDCDVQFFWRDWEGSSPVDPLVVPHRKELCSVAVWRAKEFLDKLKKTELPAAFVWKPLDREWREVSSTEVRPGMVLLLSPKSGGYSADVGWTGDPKDRPAVIADSGSTEPLEAMDDERDTVAKCWMTLTDHLREVARAVESLRVGVQKEDEDVALNGEPLPWESLIRAAWWHDVGKAHPAFQNMLMKGVSDAASRRDKLWAKSDQTASARPIYMVDGAERRGFRHELASALAWLAHHGLDANANLVAFLIAAHHGKVRGSLRSLPNEASPADPHLRFARGIWDGDELLSVDLGNGERIEATPLSLGLMELGEGEEGASWLSRILALRDEFGPFRLTFLEMLLRVADWRGTKAGDRSHEQ